MKKLSFILCIILIFQLCLYSCGKGKPQITDGTDTAALSDTVTSENDDEYSMKLDLLSEWSAYLWFMEYLYGDILWALSYIETFAASPTWENLQLARSALTTAENYIEQREPQELTLGQEDYDALMSAGYDVSHIPMSIGTTEQSKYHVLSECRLLRYDLYSEILLKTSLDELALSCRYLKEYYTSSLRYTGLETNYILAVLSDEELSQKLEEFIDTNFPYLSEHRPQLVTDIAILEAEASDELEKLDRLVDEMNVLLGYSLVTLDDMKEMFALGDISAFADKLTDIDGVPMMLPNPDWEDIEATDYRYYYYDESGNSVYTKERDELSGLPDGCVLKNSGVSREEVLAYRDMLSTLGLDPLGTDEQNGTLKIYYLLDGGSMVITLEEDTAYIFMMDEPVLFVPLWYIMASG